MAICTICQHAQKSAIDVELMQGESVRAVASRHGLSKSGVARHRTGCLAPKVAAAARIVAPEADGRAEVLRAKAIASGEVRPALDDILSLSGLLERLARSLERLEGAADSAAGDGLHAPLAALSGQLHRGIEAAAKIQGMYAEPQSEGAPRFSLTINVPDRASVASQPLNITAPADAATDTAPVALAIRFAAPSDR